MILLGRFRFKFEDEHVLVFTLKAAVCGMGGVVLLHWIGGTLLVR